MPSVTLAEAISKAYARSLKQDNEGAATAEKTVVTMRRVAGPAMIVFALTITFCD